MARIVSSRAHTLHPLTPGDWRPATFVAETICEAMAHAAKDLKMRHCCVYGSATTARMLSKYRPAQTSTPFVVGNRAQSHERAVGNDPADVPAETVVERIAIC